MADPTGSATVDRPVSHAKLETNIRLIIASSMRVVRDSLAAGLRDRDGLVVVDTVDLGPQGIAKIRDAQPDVVLVDLGQADPVTAARVIEDASPGAKLVAFALDEIDENVFACAAAGFCTYVPRESGTNELHRALLDAMEGRLHCAPHIAAAMFRLLAVLLQESSRESLPNLSLRESEILELVAQGRSNDDIARQLAISSATVKNHVHAILEKLHVRRRGQAVAQLHSYRGR
jgi:DNA-binding NarL/FixJ family response regulator